jgi:chemotaxis protein methyltransferase CheR
MAQLQRRSAGLPPEGLAAADGPREFEFSDADFRNLAQLAYEHTGITLADSKRNLVYSRVSRRVRTLGLTSFKQYREYLAREENKGEIENFINAISTNLTKFFRESHHFDHFRTHVAAEFARSLRGGGARRLRVWSAGCSTGEEPYTIAVVLRKEVPDILRHDARILATDIDTDVLAKAAHGEYPLDSTEQIPKAYLPFFGEFDGEDGGKPGLVVEREVRSLITFRRLNLMEAWPFKGLFDAIFCRNVMIYFDNPTKANLVERFTQQVKPGGWLYIGHSESLTGAHPGLKLMGRTIYRREA